MTQRKAEREDQLLETATRLFRGKGHHNASMQDLADHLGLQQSNLYSCADRVEGLLRQPLSRATTILTTLIDEPYASDLPRPKSIVAPWESQAVAIMEPPALVAITMPEPRNLPPKRLKQALAVCTHLEQVLIQTVEDGIAGGEFLPASAKMAVFGLLGHVQLDPPARRV